MGDQYKLPYFRVNSTFRAEHGTTFANLKVFDEVPDHYHEALKALARLAAELQPGLNINIEVHLLKADVVAILEKS